jgi:DNA-binding transcriptional ArsR family regulator
MSPIPIFIALADPTRCRIVELLRAGPQPVHVLAASFAISRPAISRHLRVLKLARLISEKKMGRENVYRLHSRRLEPAQQWIANMLTRIDATKSAELSKPTTQRPNFGEAAKPSVSQMGFDF